MNINVIWLDIAKRTFHLVDKEGGALYMLLSLIINMVQVERLGRSV
jgi:hypothetical protein